VVGAVTGKRVSPAALRRAFAWLVVAMGLYLISRQVPVAATVAVAAATAVAIAIAIAESRKT